MFSKPVDGYRIFTTRFDREVVANELDNVLGPLSSSDQEALDLLWSRLEYDLDELAGQKADQPGPMVQDATDLTDTAVTFLLDQSGSLKGRPMLLAAAAIRAAASLLSPRGCSVEILGFTTASWRGGRARASWKRRLHFKRPGRLCELLHIIYHDAKSGDVAALDETLRVMLRPDLPKENVDGEAVQWAAARLLGQARSRRILAVISDGSPNDPSTDAANKPGFLESHLQTVLRHLKQDDRIEVVGVGIGHHVSGWYPVSTVQSDNPFGTGLVTLLEEVLAECGGEQEEPNP